MERLPSVGVVPVPSPVAAARAGSVCVRGDYCSLDLTSPHWSGGGGEEGARDSV